MPDHRLDRSEWNVHREWDRALGPALTVESGATVAFECREAMDGGLPRDATPADVTAMEFRGHPLTGPVAVAGAEPGDTLAVDVLAVDHEGVGWTYAYPGDEGKGLLPERFPDPAVAVWDLDGDVGRWNGVALPLSPFPGNLGVAPAAEGPHSTTPPRRVGGNLDVKHLVAGSTLYLPVEVAGALFSVGDLHAAQGDGEVCVTAVEMPGTVAVRLRLADRDVDGPELETDGPFAPAGGGRALATSGVAGDLRTATERAVEAMVERLRAAHDRDRADAYLLCSVAADLKVSEVVNGNVVVTAYLARGLLAD